MSEDDPNAGGLNPALLAHVVADREARPWNYYRLDHDVMKRMLNQQRDTLDHLQAENTQLRADLARVEGERQSIDQQTQTACRLFKEEMSKAMASLSPRADHETLCGAIRNLQQAHLSEKGNAEAAEASLTRLRLQYDALLAALDKAKSWGDVEDAVTAAHALQGGEQP